MSKLISFGIFLLAFTGILFSQTVQQVVAGGTGAGTLAQVATPVDSPCGGTSCTYYANQTVTLTDATGSAVICYTLNGTTPTATTPGTCDQNTYSTGLSLVYTQTLKAIGTKVGMTNSAVDTAAYTLTSNVVLLQAYYCASTAGNFTCKPDDGFNGTSSTSNTPGTGPFTFTTQSGLQFFTGEKIRAVSHAAPATNWIEGTVTSYSSTTLVIAETSYGGSGAHTDWRFGWASSTATNLLTAQEFDFDSNPSSPTPPTSWTSDCSLNSSSKGRTTYFSYPNNPGSITSVAFTPAQTYASWAMEEWSGAATTTTFDACSTESNFYGVYSVSIPASSAQIDLAIGTNRNWTNAAGTYAPTGNWTALEDAPATAAGGEGWTEYIVNGVKSQFSETATSAAVDSYRSAAVYKSAVTGTAPTGNLTTGYCDFEAGTDGNTLTTALLQAGCHGAGAIAGQWSFNSTGQTVCTAGQINSLSNTSTNGVTYAGTGTRGYCQDLTQNGPYISYTFAKAVNQASVLVYIKTSTDVTSNTQSIAFITDGTGGDYAGLSIDAATNKWNLECKTTQPDFSFAPIASTEYILSVQYVASGTHTGKIYNSSGSLLGTQTCASEGAYPAANIHIGQSHNEASTGTLEIDNLMWDTATGAMISP
jgi:hypothetical protein